MQKVKVSKLTGNIRAQITGVRVKELDEATFNDVANAFWEHHVLVFRDQNLSIEEPIGVGQKFGELHIHHAIPHVDGYKEVLSVNNLDKNVMATEVWHSDVSRAEQPPSSSILAAINVPSYRGDTM